MATSGPETVYLEHWMPGRARLRVPKPRTAAHVRRIAGRVGRSKRVKNVSVNAETGSVLLALEPDDPIDLVLDELRILGLEILAPAKPVKPMHAQSNTAAIIRRIMAGSNARLHLATHGNVDMRLAVPALYLLLAARNFMKGRGRLRDASWYQLLYWAFDSFFKLHEEATLAGSSGSRGRVVN